MDRKQLQNSQVSCLLHHLFRILLPTSS